MGDLGGTRHDDDAPRGLLRADALGVQFTLERRLPAEDLRDVVDRHWIVRWDLRDQPSFEQQVLPHPCVNLVFEASGPAVYGVVEGRFARRLEAQGEALGTKFLPGAFSPFAAVPVVSLTDRAVPFADALGPPGAQLAREGAAAATVDARIDLVEAFLRARRPVEPDPGLRTVAAAVRAMLDGPVDLRVADVAARLAVSPRTLQRLFRTHVGVSPKWVLQRYRLHEAAERMASGEATEPAALALDLGYFDQAHFGNDFRRYVGVPPAAYAAMVADAAG